jgi:Rrf2 family protein
MKLTTRGRYAVMALADIAVFDKGNPVPLRDISLRQNISLVYLEQIFSKLKKNNIVKSIRGANGGYVLTEEPEKVKLLKVFLAVDESIKTVQCKKESKKACNGKSTKCITHNLWDELEMYINDFFSKKSLKDLINQNIEKRIQ